MQNIAKTALIICAAVMAYITQDYRFLIFWFFVLFDWE